MNVCNHCGNGKGWFFIYKDINEMVKNMTEFELFAQISKRKDEVK